MERLTVSVSQLEAFDSMDGDGCPRKWWAEHVINMPRPPSKGSQVFGTAFHAVCERYLRADDLGRDPVSRQPVDLYPPGWHQVTERNGSKGELVPVEQDKVRVLFEKLLQEGYIARWPNRLVEFEFGAVWKGQPAFPLINYKGYEVGFMGLIDVCLPDQLTVLDWKTTKRRSYAKSANKLRASLQMLGYAKVLLAILEARGAAMPSQVQLVHVVAVHGEDPMSVKRTPVWVSLEEIEAGWDRIQRLARAMVDTMIFQSEDRWFDVPGPRERSNACNAYGGCPRQLVCTGRHSPEQHRRNVDLLVQRSVESPVASLPRFIPTPSQQKNGYAMGLLANRAAASTAGAAPAPSQPAQPGQVVAPPQQPQPVTQPQQPEPLQYSNPPWADPNCTACGTSSHNGWNTAGNACRICNGTSSSKGGALSDHYEITQSGEARYWTAKPEHEQFLRGIGAPLRGVSHVVPTAAVETVQTPAQYVQPTPQALPQALQQAAGAAAPVAPAQPAPSSMPQPGAFQAALAAEQPAPASPPPQPVPPAPAPQPVPAAPQEAQAPAPATAPLEDPGGGAAPAGPVTATEELVKPKAGRGRPKGGFTLFINCAPVGTSVEDLGQIHQRMGAQLAETSGVGSFHELHPFARRDCLAAAAQQVATFLGKSKVVAMASSPDMVAFIDAVRPYATQVVEARLPVLHDGRG